MKFEKFSNPFHPGEMLLEEFLEPMKLTQSAFAGKLGWSARKLNEIIKGKRGVTATSALDLADALKTTPEYWTNLQVTFDLAQAYKIRERKAA
jgi:addiction module HigA family antidote